MANVIVQWEWAILMLLFLGLLCWELLSTRRAIRRAKEEESRPPT